MTTIPCWAKDQIKGTYGDYLLASLPSGKWALVWHASLENEDLLRAVLTEDAAWFERQMTFAPPPSFPTQTKALEHLVEYLEDQQRENFWAKDTFLKWARAALRRASKVSPEVS